MKKIFLFFILVSCSNSSSPSNLMPNNRTRERKIEKENFSFGKNEENLVLYCEEEEKLNKLICNKLKNAKAYYLLHSNNEKNLNNGLIVSRVESSELKDKEEIVFYHEIEENLNFYIIKVILEDNEEIWSNHLRILKNILTKVDSSITTSSLSSFDDLTILSPEASTEKDEEHLGVEKCLEDSFETNNIEQDGQISSPESTGPLRTLKKHLSIFNLSPKNHIGKETSPEKQNKKDEERRKKEEKKRLKEEANYLKRKKIIIDLIDKKEKIINNKKENTKLFEELNEIKEINLEKLSKKDFKDIKKQFKALDLMIRGHHLQ